MLWLALAAQLSLPTPANKRIHDVRAVFTADDFPDYLQRAGVSRIVYTRTTVRPDGSVQSCTAEISSGDTKLGAYTCGIIVKRAKFTPATWTDGTPVFGVMRLPVSWTITDSPPTYEDSLKASVPDIDVSVDRLPKEAHSIAGVSLQVAADERGRPVSCVDYPPIDKSLMKRHFPELVPLACQQVMTTLSLVPPVDVSGKAVRSIQSVSVRFKVDQSADSQTPEAAMQYLVRTLPRLKSLDTWDGGHSEATFDRAWVIDRCRLGTGAPFDKIYSDFGDEHEAPIRQSWWTDFSNVTGVGQLGNRAIYKTSRNQKIVLGIVAPDAEVAGRIARAMETLRLACINSQPPKR